MRSESSAILLIRFIRRIFDVSLLVVCECDLNKNAGHVMPVPCLAFLLGCEEGCKE